MQAFGWRAVFWLNVPIVLSALVVAVRVLPAAGGDRERRMDLIGAGLGAIGLALMVYAASERQWPSAVAAVLVLAGFVYCEHARRMPVLPLRLFSERRFALSNAGALVMNGSCQGMLYLTTLLLQQVQGRSPLLAGLAALPLFLPLMLLPPRAGRLVARFGPLRVAAAALLLTAVGVCLLAVIGRDTPYPVMAMVFLLWGGGLGILTPALVTGALGAAPVAMSGLASAVNNTARQAGGSVGVAVCAGLAGPVTAAGFLAGFRVAALLMAGVCLLAAAVLVTGSGARGTLRGL